MKKFTRENIDRFRGMFVEKGYPQKQSNLDGRVVDYFVMPKPLFQGIPNGLVRMTGDPQDGYVVGVSDEVPLEIQPHFALSEHDEFMVYGLGDLDRTLRSERHMLGILGGSNLKPTYITNKLTLYGHLLANAKDNSDTWLFTEEDLRGFERACEHLREAL
ncbi:MAG: hypothetical protein AABY05_03230 [Nanoarchaeota archaeon]